MLRNALVLAAVIAVTVAATLAASGQLDVPFVGAEAEPAGVISDADAVTVRIGDPRNVVVAKLGEPAEETADVGGSVCLAYAVELDPSIRWRFCLGPAGQVINAQRG